MLNICNGIYTLIKMKRLVVLTRTALLLVALSSIIIPSAAPNHKEVAPKP